MNAQNNPDRTGNELFPVFLKLNELKVLLVGAGNVGLEKLNALLANSPGTRITVVAENVRPEFINAASGNHVTIIERRFEEKDLDDQDLLIVATGNDNVNREIRNAARKRRLLINVADKPELCDFYLGSVVKKGDLKLGISTNGKSPTMAKRLKEVLQEAIPDDVDLSLQQLNRLRNSLTGDFAEKVARLNEATAMLVEPEPVKGSQMPGNLIIWLAGIILLAILVVSLL